MRKIAENFGMAVVILLMVIAVFTFFGPRFGWRVDAVLSGSMEPALKVGGVLVTYPVKVEEIKVKDIIIFYSPMSGELTSHRVVAMNHGSSVSFRTKGDANEDPDPFTVPASNVVGKKFLHIPWLGYLTQLVKTRLGFLLALCIPALIVIGMEMKNIWQILADEEVEREYRVMREEE